MKKKQLFFLHICFCLCFIYCNTGPEPVPADTIDPLGCVLPNVAMVKNDKDVNISTEILKYVFKGNFEYANTSEVIDLASIHEDTWKTEIIDYLICRGEKLDILKSSEDIVYAKMFYGFLMTSPSTSEYLAFLEKFPPPGFQVKETRGEIVIPGEGDTVCQEFEFLVVLNNIKDDQCYWLCNEIDGLCWPKIQLNPSTEDLTINGTSNEGGSPKNGMFNIVLYEIDYEEHLKIIDWQEKKDFSGLNINGTILDKISVKLIE